MEIKGKVQQTDKHVFVKNKELWWEILWFCGILPRYTSIHQSPMNTVAQTGQKRLWKPAAFLLLLKWVHLMESTVRQSVTRTRMTKSSAHKLWLCLKQAIGTGACQEHNKVKGETGKQGLTGSSHMPSWPKAVYIHRRDWSRPKSPTPPWLTVST